MPATLCTARLYCVIHWRFWGSPLHAVTKFGLAVRRHAGQDVAMQCSCVSQELAEETSQEQCMIVVKLVVDQAGRVMVNLLRVGAFTKFWLELQADYSLLYDRRVQRPDWPQKTVQQPVFSSQFTVKKIDGTVIRHADSSTERQGTYVLQLSNHQGLAFHHFGRQVQRKQQQGWKV